MELETDILIVGSGISGVLLALELAQLNPKIKITIITKSNANQSSSFLAQGGIAASFPNDTSGKKEHIENTLSAGGGVNNRSIVEYIVNHSFKVIHTLENWGVQFDKTSTGDYILALEGGHSKPRVFHHKDFTGRHIMEVLLKKIKKIPSVQLIEHTELIDLFKDNERISSGLLWDTKRNVSTQLYFQEVVLATGGTGNLFRYTTNPSTACGSAFYLAKKMGATLDKPHYIQFHPTALFQKGEGISHLISEAVRGAGAILRNEQGIAFMETQHPLKDLAPRDIVSRCILSEINKQKLPYVFLDCSTIDKVDFMEEFPDIFKICAQHNIHLPQSPIPVVPVAHYSCGGIKTSIFGDCGVPGLKVIGESANTGLHGANRLASNSLLEACIMSISLANHLCNKKSLPQPKTFIATLPHPTTEGKKNYLILEKEIKKIMHQYIYVEESMNGLNQAKKELELLSIFFETHFERNSVERNKAISILEAATSIVVQAKKEVKNIGVFYNKDLVLKKGMSTV